MSRSLYNDEVAERLREIINNYAKNPEYTNSEYTMQEAVTALNDHIRRQYFRIKQD